MPALIAGEFVAVIGVYDHHAVTFRHFAREFARHHFSISLFFFHNNLNIEIQGPARPRQYLFFGYGKRKDSQAIASRNPRHRSPFRRQRLQFCIRRTPDIAPRQGSLHCRLHPFQTQSHNGLDRQRAFFQARDRRNHSHHQGIRKPRLQHLHGNRSEGLRNRPASILAAPSHLPRLYDICRLGRKRKTDPNPLDYPRNRRRNPPLRRSRYPPQC